MTKNNPKPYNVTTSNVFLTPKMVKAGKTRIFPDTTLPFDDSKQLFQVSDQVLDKSDMRIWRKCPKTYFLAKNLAVFGQNLENENFFQKSAWNIFFVLSRYNFVQKIIKIWCAVFQIWCDAQTDARAWIHRSSS